MIINNLRVSGTTPIPVRWWLDFKFDLFIPSSNTNTYWWFFFIDTISMEIRLAFLTENEIKCFMIDTMQTNIRKNTSFNFKLYCIELSNCLLHCGNIIGQPNSCYIKTCPRTKNIFELKINRKSIFWELRLSLLEYISIKYCSCTREQRWPTG